MSVFASTFAACQQMSLLGLDIESAADQASRDFTDVGVSTFFRRQMDDMRRAGQKVSLAREERNCAIAVLSWRLPGRQGHPRDTYLLTVQLDGAGATARFLGPSRKTQALALATRHLTPDTLTRWTATFFEWALTSRESR